jgi:hypothetical protein
VVDAWVTNHLARTFAHVIYGVTNAAAMTNDINLAAGRNVGWIFVTDDTNAANPYERLPVYWTNEVNYVHSLNGAQPPTQLTMLSFSNGVPELQINGAPGVYELQASSNLVDWAFAAMLDVSVNTQTVRDAGANNSSRRFYRARQ